MGAVVHGELGREQSARAYKEALVALREAYPLHIFGIKEYVRHLRKECAKWRNQVRDDERRIELLRAEVRELREALHE